MKPQEDASMSMSSTDTSSSSDDSYSSDSSIEMNMPTTRAKFVHGARLSRTFLDFSSCPALDDLKISLCVINVSKIVCQTLKHLKIFRCQSSLVHRVQVSAPSLVSFKLDGFSGRSPLLERMLLLETSSLNFDTTSSQHIPHDICLHYSHSGVFYGINDVKCVSCLYNDGSSNSSVLLGALDNAKHLKLMSPSGMIIFTRDLKWCPTFHNLRNLLLNDYWCMCPDFSALTCILKHSPVLEELTLQLVSEGVRPNMEMKGSYISMERSTVIPQHMMIVNVKCNVVDEKVAKVLKFLHTLNHRPRCPHEATRRRQQVRDTSMMHNVTRSYTKFATDHLRKFYFLTPP